MHGAPPAVASPAVAPPAVAPPAHTPRGPAPLRCYQQKIVESARAEYRQGRRAILVVLPTGGGKTRVGAEFVLGAVARGRRVLWLAHRRELVLQAYERIRRDGVENIGVVAASARHLARPSAPVQVASLQTLVAREAAPPADLVIFDEAHHYVAADWRQFADRYAGAARLGLTATPVRSDGAPLGDIFDGLVVGATIAQLVGEGFLVPCETIAPPRNLKQDLAQDPVEAWRAFGRGRSTVVFAKNVTHGKDLTAALAAAGARARFVDGETPAVLREQALRAFGQGSLDVIVNVFVLTEGWDAPRADVCILARSCGSPGTFLQMVGRVLRPAPGKEKATLVDLSGAVHLHGLPEDERSYSLSGKGMARAAQLPPLRTCMMCGCTFRSAPRCPRCGTLMAEPKRVRITGDKLERVTTVDRAGREREVFARLLKIQQEKGYRPGWVSKVFEAKFGHRPGSDLWKESA